MFSDLIFTDPASDNHVLLSQSLLQVGHHGWWLGESSLSSAETSYFFVRAGNWGEVKSKRAEPGENRNESARGTLGREKERREALLCINVMPVF